MSVDPCRTPDETARRLGTIAAEAGRFLAGVTDRGQGRRVKADGSSTTAADIESERLIIARLAERWPAIPVVAEESACPADAGHLFFLVDPLDGTSDYLGGAGEYAVNIALVLNGRPVAAAIAAPGAGRVWVAGSAAEVGRMSPAGVDGWIPARVRPAPATGLVALVSRRHGDTATETCLGELPVTERQVASSAYKFCLVASGEADLYVRCGPTMEWDIAAGDHIVAQAGGTVVGPGGTLTYGHAARGYRNGPFAAVGDAAVAARLKLPLACA